MIDPAAAPLPSGAGGTRLSLARFMVYLGAACVGAAAFIHQAEMNGGSLSWFPVVLAGIGVIKTLMGFLGYVSSETQVKVEALRARAAASAAVSDRARAIDVLRVPGT